MDSNFHGVSSSGEIHGVPESIINPSSPQPELISVKVDSALRLNRDTVNYGKYAAECFYNLNLCKRGLSISLWLKPYTNQVRILMACLTSIGIKA